MKNIFFYAFLGLLLTSGIIASYFLYNSVLNLEKSSRKEGFIINTQNAVTNFESSLHTSKEKLRNLNRFFDASNYVSYEEFKIFTKSFSQDQDGFEAAAWAPKISKNKVEDFLEKYKDSTSQVGRIKFLTDHFENETDYCYPIYYVYPESYGDAVGYDLLSEENRYKAILAAEETGQIQATKPIELATNNKTGRNFVLFLHRDGPNDKDLKIAEGGTLIMTLNSNELFEKVFEPYKAINFVVLDITDINRAPIVHYATNSDIDAYRGLQKDDSFVKRYPVNFAGRQLEIIAYQKIGYMQDHDLAILIFILGFLLTSSFTAYLCVIKNRNILFKAAVADRTKELKDTNDFLKVIMENVPSMVFVKDREFKIVEANQALLNAYPEDQRDKVIGYTTYENFPEDQVKDFTAADQKAFDEGFSEKVEDITFLGSAEKTLLTRKIRFEDKEGQEFILGVATDITQLKKIERDLRISNDELRQFAYIASHDLKTPLRHISLSVDFLTQDHEKELSEKAREYLNMIKNSCERMYAMIESVLDLSQLSAYDKKDSFENIQIKEIIEYCQDTLGTNRDDYELIYDQNNSLAIKADHALISRLFINLIENAIKYKKPDEDVRVTVETEKEGRYTVISIADNGIGIEPQYAEKVFKIFQRLHTQQEIKGTGIGLAVCKRIMEIHDGEIELDTDYKGGARFILKFPLSA